ncbi:MAG: KEOPS complex subunit Pcc1 [Candidatus Bathyarchaeia archaeon]
MVRRIVLKDIKVEARIMVPFISYSSLKAIWRAIATDEKDQPTPRASFKTKIEKRTLRLIIKTDDISSLRATLNSNIRIVLAWMRIVEALKNI